MATEKELIKRAKNGEVEAFEELISTHEKLIYNISYRMAGNPDDAADMAQEVLIKVFRNIQKFKGDSKFSTWIYRVATNTCLDNVKKMKRHVAFSLDSEVETDEGSIGFDPVDTAPTPEEALISGEMKDSINDAILKLSPEHRQVIVLVDVNGISYEDAAKI
ncbi:MAG: sigma-70 family RNA polymerase sigma factor, partial [Oscillospiraceae bacterium]